MGVVLGGKKNELKSEISHFDGKCYTVHVTLVLEFK